MTALDWHGRNDIRCDTMSDPGIAHPRDASPRFGSGAICSADPHLVHHGIPATTPGERHAHGLAWLSGIGGIDRHHRRGTPRDIRERSDFNGTVGRAHALQPSAARQRASSADARR